MKTPIPIPNEGIKAKLIGRDGRVIRGIKKQFNVSIIIDDTPGLVFLDGEGDIHAVKGLILKMIQENKFVL